MNFNFRTLSSYFIIFNILIIILVSCNEKEDSSTSQEKSVSEKAKPEAVKEDSSKEEIAANTAHLKKPDKSLTGAAKCTACHEKEVNEWTGSHHDMAMKVASPESVKGNFDNSEFTHKGRTTKFYKKDKEYFVLTPNEKGEMQEYKVTHTFGIHPLQQYMVSFPGGRKQCLHIAWDDVKKQWYHLYGNMDIEDGEWLNWTGGSQNWNSMCADCHSTELKKNFDPQTNSYSTSYKVINVSCEACHGPSDQHILAKMNPEEKLGNGDLFKGLKKDNTPVNRDEIEKCARCHSRRSQLTSYYDHKGTFMDHYLPEILRDNVYHKDGQILDEVYVYGSFAQSKMYHNNVRCTDCHNPHTNKLKLEGNALCMQCHSKTPEKAFDTPAHHFHQPGSEGAKCVNCHMMGKHYMGIDFRRDHSFRIPRPDQTVKYGTPNACNDCHKDKKAEWAVEAIEKVHGKERKPHFSDLLIPGKDRYKPRFDLLAQLAEDTTQPAIARATAIWMLQPLNTQAVYSIANKLLLDKEPLVRYHALGVFAMVPKSQRIAVIGQMLNDPVRAIRIETANQLSDSSVEDLKPELKVPFANAMNEFNTYLEMHADSAGGQVNISNYHSRKNNSELAIEALKNAVKIDDHFNMARMNLAYMLSLDQKYEEAEKVYLKVLEQEPYYSQAWYSLGLLYTETKNFAKAVEVFSKAIAREPDNLRMYYNKALSLQKLGLNEEAEEVFLDALKREVPKDQNVADIFYGLIMLQLEMKQMEKASQSIASFVQAFGQNHPYMQYIGQKMKELQKGAQP